MQNSLNSSLKPFAVVTGASNGIGFELAKQFVKAGYDLIIAAGDDAINAAAARLRDAGAAVESAQVDLASYEGVEELYTKIHECRRPVAALAVNAGVGIGDFSRRPDLDDELKLIELNVVSTVHLTKRVLKDMIRQNEGRVLLTASVASKVPGSFEAACAASKAFVLAFSETIRNDLKNTRVTVTAMLPGPNEKKDDAADARQCLDAMMAGKETVGAAGKKTETTPGTKTDARNKQQQPVAVPKG